jgi:hypothetical protein
MSVKRLYKMCPKCGCARFNIPAGACSSCGYVKPKPAAVKLPQRHPLAWGMCYWGPLPDTRETFVSWDGPGSGLYLNASDPATATLPGLRIRHASACATYATTKEAEKALAAFIAAGTEDS